MSAITNLEKSNHKHLIKAIIAVFVLLSVTSIVISAINSPRNDPKLIEFEHVVLQAIKDQDENESKTVSIQTFIERVSKKYKLDRYVEFGIDKNEQRPADTWSTTFDDSSLGEFEILIDSQHDRLKSITVEWKKRRGQYGNLHFITYQKFELWP